MLLSEARIETESASYYLVKLCRHFEQKSHAMPHLDYRGLPHEEVDVRVRWSDIESGSATFDFGRCVLLAEPDLLTLRAEAPDEEGLERVKALVGEHLDRFGRRERLRTEWQPPQRSDEPYDAVQSFAAAHPRHNDPGHARG